MSLSPGGPCLSCLGLCGTLSRILVRPRRRFEAMWDAVLEPNCRRLACLGLGGSMSPSPGGPCLSCLGVVWEAVPEPSQTAQAVLRPCGTLSWSPIVAGWHAWGWEGRCPQAQADRACHAWSSARCCPGAYRHWPVCMWPCRAPLWTLVCHCKAHLRPFGRISLEAARGAAPEPALPRPPRGACIPPVGRTAL